MVVEKRGEGSEQKREYPDGLVLRLLSCPISECMYRELCASPFCIRLLQTAQYLMGILMPMSIPTYQRTFQDAIGGTTCNLLSSFLQ